MDENEKKRRKSLNKITRRELERRIINTNFGTPIPESMQERRRGQRRVGSTNRNHREDALINAIDMKANITKVASMFERIGNGKLDMNGAITEMSMDALKELSKFMYSENVTEKTKLDAVKYLLGIAGYVPVQKHAVASVDASTSKEQLLSIIAGSSRTLDNEGIEIIDDRDDDSSEETD